MKVEGEEVWLREEGRGGREGGRERVKERFVWSDANNDDSVTPIVSCTGCLTMVWYHGVNYGHVKIYVGARN